jgi:hypothetical protein
MATKGKLFNDVLWTPGQPLDTSKPSMNPDELSRRLLHVEKILTEPGTDLVDITALGRSLEQTWRPDPQTLFEQGQLQRAVNREVYTDHLPVGQDGMEIYYYTGRGIWHLRFDKDAGFGGSGQWIPVGDQPPLIGFISGDNTVWTQRAIGTTYAAAPFHGSPTVTIPETGEYSFSLTALVVAPAANGMNMALKRGAAATSEFAATRQSDDSLSWETMHATFDGDAVRGDVCTIHYKLDTATIAHISQQRIEARPINLENNPT